LVLGGQEPSRPAQSEGSGMPVSNQPPLGDVLEPLDLGGWGGRRFGRSGRRRGAGQGRLDASLPEEGRGHMVRRSFMQNDGGGLTHTTTPPLSDRSFALPLSGIARRQKPSAKPDAVARNGQFPTSDQRSGPEDLLKVVRLSARWRIFIGALEYLIGRCLHVPWPRRCSLGGTCPID
jgi:hypothetical protein